MRRLIFPVAAVLLVALVIMCKQNRNAVEKSVSLKAHAVVEIKDEEPKRLLSYANRAKAYVNKKGLCSRYCFLIDMRIVSGKKRFFIYDLENDTVINAGMVTHGSGSVTGTEVLKYSNEAGSNATSQGRYKTGAEYNGTYGLAFKLHGLDVTNSNAYKRAVVLHSHRLVPDDETWPQGICTSWGCPTVSPGFLQVLKKYIEEADKPVLLWIME